ncbi:hypothetical protein [Bacillus sp. B-jedd]|uniref:hypothetical protein n=1 Tax=Bacillus sp. B-jedd TaxID=1476857 RepID=UPI000515666E|nr:hypothetical protein [Bacillus sp. B-jedd]CEG25312.1 hypothetical protein BN1002_00105 [Bacillus sp. B-jedd]
MSVLIAKNLLDRIHLNNEKLLQNIDYENKDIEYQQLYKAFWLCNLRIKNAIEFLEIIRPEEHD